MEFDNLSHTYAKELQALPAGTSPQEPQQEAEVLLGEAFDDEHIANLEPETIPVITETIGEVTDDPPKSMAETNQIQAAAAAGQAVMSEVAETTGLEATAGTEYEVLTTKEEIQEFPTVAPSAVESPYEPPSPKQSTTETEATDNAIVLTDSPTENQTPEETASQRDVSELAELIQHSLADGDTETLLAHPVYGHVAEELPGFAKTAEAAGISPEQAGELLAHTLGHMPDDHKWLSSTVPLLGRALEASALIGNPLSEEDIAGLKNLIADAGHSDSDPGGVVLWSLLAYDAACRAGLPPEVGSRLINNYIDHGNPKEVPYLWDALRAFDGAGVDPAVIQEAFECIQAFDPAVQAGMYGKLAAIICHSQLMNRITPAEAMTKIVPFLKKGDVSDVSDVSTDIKASLRGMAEKPLLERDEYFRKLEGPLVHRGTPYRAERSWKQGLQDLVRLEGAQPHRGETKAEGFWVYDPNTSTWHSYGGKTYPKGKTGVYHRFTFYDPSKVSETPSTLHIHPRIPSDFYPYGAIIPSRADYSGMALILEHAEEPVQNMRSFVVHEYGITEYTHPTDPEAIRAMTRDYWGDIISEYRHWIKSPETTKYRETSGMASAAEYLFKGINFMLPPGFSVKFYPRDVTVEGITYPIYPKP